MELEVLRNFIKNSAKAMLMINDKDLTELYKDKGHSIDDIKESLKTTCILLGEEYNGIEEFETETEYA